MYITPNFPTANSQLWGIAGYTIEYYPCYGACSECSSSFSTTCDACILDAGLVYDSASTSCECVYSNYYIDESDGFVCKPCSERCLTCDGPNANDCLTCDTFNFLTLDSATKTCVCQISYYLPNPTDLRCDACDPECLTCSGPANTECLTCDATKLYTYESSNSTCLCPVGYYSYRTDTAPLSATCLICDSTCTSCRTNSLYCWSCADGYYREDAE